MEASDGRSGKRALHYQETQYSREEALQSQCEIIKLQSAAVSFSCQQGATALVHQVEGANAKTKKIQQLVVAMGIVYASSAELPLNLRIQ